MKTDNLINKIRASIIGERHLIPTPFGSRPLVYADYTASGRALSFLEDYIRDNVLPLYANTHTASSFTGAQISMLREEARNTIKSMVNAGEDHCLVFCGSGATAAINKIIDMLGLKLPNRLDKRYGLSARIPAEERPVIFLGPYEHHSNELPWRETIAEVVSIPLDHDGVLDLSVLEAMLVEYSAREMKIGSFSAASNVTGIKTDVNAVTRLLHKHGAYAFWDYAAAAPYVRIDVLGNQEVDGDSSKDAVFISPHKLVGGPGTPGILIFNRKLVSNAVPTVPGGGTVQFVTPEGHLYHEDLERREEGGTPAIIESIRAGLAFSVQQEVDVDEIELLEDNLVRRAIQRLSRNDHIEILGNSSVPRLAILSLQIHRLKKPLHYGFVVALLNDLFGIQARGGCSCAGPYAHRLLHIDKRNSQALEREMLCGHGILRPGWVRLNFNYFIDEECFDYILAALEIIADHGWRLLPYYEYDKTSGVWCYQSRGIPKVIGLSGIINSANLTCNSLDEPQQLSRYLTDAIEILTTKPCDHKVYDLALPASADALRWFYLPADEIRK